jgi:hypothetical protein
LGRPSRSKRGAGEVEVSAVKQVSEQRPAFRAFFLKRRQPARSGLPQTSGLGFEGRVWGFLANRTPIAIK